MTNVLLALTMAAISLLSPASGVAAQTLVAVAANFSAPMKLIGQDFERSTGYRLRTSFGATGQFHAQIRNGAPFAILLSADSATPERLERETLAVPGGRFTYAIGRLALWSPRSDGVDASGQVLLAGTFDRIALANPRIAPYGAAAHQVLDRLGLGGERLANRLLEGVSIAQVYQFVASGNATIGFVSLSQIYRDGTIAKGSAWVVPEHLYEPIRQDAVLLNPGAGDAAARAFLDYLRGPAAQSIIRSFGYAIAEERP